MTNMNIRFLHEQLANDLSKVLDRQVVVLGCGAIGANLAISLARRGFKNFLLVDRDRIQEHNVSTQPWSPFDIGHQKTIVLSNILCCTATILHYETKNVTSAGQITRRIEPQAVIVDSFDNRAARQVACELGKSYDVLHVGMSVENTAEVTWNENYAVPEDIALADPCNYPLSRTLVELSVVAASEAIIRFLLTGQKQSYIIRADDLNITKI